MRFEQATIQKRNSPELSSRRPSLARRQVQCPEEEWLQKLVVHRSAPSEAPVDLRSKKVRLPVKPPFRLNEIQE